MKAIISAALAALAAAQDGNPLNPNQRFSN